MRVPRRLGALSAASCNALRVNFEALARWHRVRGGVVRQVQRDDEGRVLHVALHDVHCFVPTVSAMALATDDPFFDIAGAGVFWPAPGELGAADAAAASAHRLVWIDLAVSGP